MPNSPDQSTFDAEPLFSASTEVATDGPEREPLPESLEVRIESAMAECAVELTPEVTTAIREYYTEHYELAGVIDEALSDPQPAPAIGDLESASKEFGTGEELYPVITAHRPQEMTERIRQILDREAGATDEPTRSLFQLEKLRQVSAAFEILFQETSLPITTLGAQERALIERLYDKLDAAAKIRGNGSYRNQLTGSLEWGGRGVKEIRPDKQRLLDSLADAQESFWEDCRYAGQLEFHNTGYMHEITTTGGLMPRTEQFRRTGTMRFQTAAYQENMHSIVPHFSEQYDPTEYKKGRDGESPNRKAKDARGATIAIPLAEVIKTAPFARDAEYAEVMIKRGTDPDQAPTVPTPTLEGTTTLDVGHDDWEGAVGTDRTFFAAPNEDGPVKPDQYEFPMDRDVTIILYGDEEISRSENYGIGESLPGRLHISEQVDPADAVAELQRRTFEDPRYKDKLIVPLRRGVFEFVAEGMPVRQSRGRGTPDFVDNPLN